jgi:hypothetical protein
MADPFASIAKPDPFASIAKPIAKTAAPVATAPSPVPPPEGVGTGLLKGIGEGLIQTGTALSPLINKIPYIGETLAPSAGIAGARELARPVNTSQTVGKAGEQIAEWLIPSGLEEKAGVYGAKALGALAPHAPAIIEKAAPVVARMGEQAIESGLRNKAQGGTFTTGAAAGAAGPIIAPALSKGAEGLANIAMSPGKRVLKSLPEGVDIGRTVMQESTGVRPATITRQLGEKVTAADANLTGLLQNAKAHGTQIPLAPARQLIANEMTSAVAKNAPEYIQDVEKVSDQLTHQYGPAGRATIPLPATVDPVRARALKQGVDLTIGNFNPEAQSAIAPLQERVRGAIAGGIHSAVPGSGALDLRMSNLIPAKDAAWNVSYNPTIARSVFNRVARPTGALAGALFGGTEGYRHGGVEGAVGGAGIGLVAPELIASPTGQMIMARVLTSPRSMALVKGLGLQTKRQLVDKDQPPE